MSNVLTLCKRCDDRWTLATIIGLVLVLSPLWIPPLMMWMTFEKHLLPSIALLYAIGASFPVALAAWLWARSKLIQTQSIDEDGTIGLRNVHPETRDTLVALGEADYLPGSTA